MLEEAPKPAAQPGPIRLAVIDTDSGFVRVLTNRLINHPSVGDIVVFHPPRGADPQPPVCGNPMQGSGLIGPFLIRLNLIKIKSCYRSRYGRFSLPLPEH